MQFSEKWLREIVNPEMKTDELAHLLTMSGLEVEEIEAVAPPFSRIVVAHVLEVNKHPNADRLTVCRVDAGTGSILDIVCGAPNVYAGMKTACALVGAILPPGEDGKPFEIKLGKLRGVESQGMLCSARELKLSDDHSGLMDLPSDAPLGNCLRDYLALDDVMVTIKLTPNRADCLSILGVAREVSALTGKVMTFPSIVPVTATMEETLPVQVLAPDLCGRFSGRIVRGINAKAETPDWMKQRLERSGQRPVSVLVDISNYVMLESGQPTHVFDLGKIKGGLEVRWGKSGESLALLNGDTVTVDERVGVIADETGIESLAGIMGGDRTAVTLDTQDIYIEAAFWLPSAIQGRTRRYHFTTDAAHRFERGVDFSGTVTQIERITSLVLEICGVEGKTAIGPIDDQIVNLPQRKPVRMRTARAEKLIGVSFSEEQIAAIFTSLGMPFTLESGVFSVSPPAYRFDIEIEEDLIEEVARVYGFEKIPALPPIAANVMRVAPEGQRSLFSIRHQMADQDYQEVVNYSFVEESWEKDFSDNAELIRLVNPIASQMSVMRSSLIGGLIANTRYNLNRKFGRVRLFEIGPVFLRDSAQVEGPLTVGGYRQPKHLAALAYGGVAEEQWGLANRNVDFFDIKADLEALVAPRDLRFVKSTHPAFHPGRCARIEMDGKQVGVIGELHPLWQQKYELPLAPVLFEIEVALLQLNPIPVYREIAHFQPVIRDVALVVKQEVEAQALLDVFYGEKNNNSVCNIMQTVVLFDHYRGKGLENDEKSLAFRFTLQDTQGTLQDDIVDAAMKAFIAAAELRQNARLRG